MKLHDLDASGNCYKVRLFAALANIELDIEAVDMTNDAHKQPTIVDLNPLGQLPILEDGKHVLRDSQSILVYLAGVYGGLVWWSAHPQGQAEIVQWLSSAANPVPPFGLLDAAHRRAAGLSAQALIRAAACADDAAVSRL